MPSHRILVVDDSPTIQTTVEWLLSTHGYVVKVEQDGLSALSALRTFHPDLIVLDIRLEHFDGVELLQMIRQMATYKETPVVMLSALNSTEDQQRARDAGANDYVTKPLKDVAFVEVVEKHLAHIPPTHDT